MKKLIGIFFTILIIAALFLFILGRINTLVFWIVVIVSAIVAYKIIPKLK